MAIQEFKWALSKQGLSIGARWLKVDFHVHLPTSPGYEYKGDDAFERLGKALEASKLSYAIVLKHESYTTKSELARLQAHCPSVTLVPGAEINIIVDALFKKIGKDYFCHCIAATDPADEGEYGYALRSATDKYQYRDGEYPAGFRSSLLDVGRHFREKGDLFIAAHLHQGKSAENSRSVDDLYDDEAFLGFINDGAFDALEVRQASTAAFFDGGSTTQDGMAIPRAPCVSSSDAHHHDHLAARNRATWVRVEHRTFAELKAALALPHRVSLVAPEAFYPRLIGLHVVGAFIPDTWVNLNESLNALIGSKGTGKTALLECIRFVLNTPVPKERSESVDKHMQHILGSAGYVECLVQDGSGEERLIVRRADSRDRIVITDSRGEISTVSAGPGPAFPISILGWHEIESVADRASARIGILDRTGEPQRIQQAYDGIQSHIARARDQLPLLQRQVRRLSTSLKELWELQRKRSTLARLEQGELLGLQNQYEWFLQTEQRLAAIESGAAKRRGQLGEVIPSRLEIGIPVAPAETPLGDLDSALADLTNSAALAQASEVTATNDMSAALDELRASADLAGKALARSFAEFRDGTYTPRVNALPPEDREILARQIQVLEETKRLPTVETTCAEQLRELRALAADLYGACNSVCNLREDIIAMRSTLVASLNTELPGVRLEFKRSANHEARARFQGSYGTEAASVISYVDAFSGRDGYEKLRDLFEKLQSLDLAEASWKIQDALLDAKLVALLDVIDDDDVDLLLSVDSRGFVPIQNLSAGQRCVAVFPLLLRNTRGPLVIDQPEDNLDNRYIADIIGPELLKKKRGQQYVVTSHNANLVVLTDADLIIHLDSDGSRATFPAAGFLACPDSRVKGSVLDVLDGGEAALLARQMKYGIGGT